MSNKYPGGLITSGANAGYSVAFDGTGDYLTVANNTALQMGTGDFQVEAWVYTTNASAFQSIICIGISTGGSTAGTFTLRVQNDLKVRWCINDNSTGLTSTNAITVNTWTHVCVSRVSGTTRIFLNGVSNGSLSDSTNYNNTSGTMIGAENQSGAVNTMYGYISNLRVVKGSGVTSLNVPTQLVNISGTSLLTCNSPAIVDQSSNAFAITANGNAAVSTFTPFQGYVAYNPALGAATPGIWSVSDAIQAAQTRRWNMYDPYFNLTTLLLHGNGTNGAQNNTFLDSSSNNFTITRNNNTTQGTFSPFSQTGWSNYFNAAYLSAGTSSDFSFAGNFTIEMWYYSTITTDQSLILMGSSPYFAINVQAGTGYSIYLNNATPSFSPNNIVPQANTWNHVALVRSGSTVTVYHNGTALSTTATNSSTLGYSGNAFNIGWSNANSYISNLRVVNGTAVYTSNFTPSTTPLTDVTNTKLLTCQSNRFVDTNTQVTAKTITVASGTPSVQAFSPFAPTAAYSAATNGGSGYFDGTGDYLSIANNTAFNVGTGDFSIEGWVYMTSTGQYAIAGNGSSGFVLYFDSVASGRKIRFSEYGVASIITGATAVTNNAWNHILITRSGTTVRAFLNGILDATATSSANFDTATALQIGADGDATTPGSLMLGYIADFRLIKGSIPTSYQTSSTTVGTSIFTPPTAPVTTSSQGASAPGVLTNFTNAGITDATAKNVLETVGGAQISTTQSKFGGSSMYFDGTDDRLVLPSSQNLAFGTAPYTVEMWMNVSNLSALRGLFVMGNFRFFQNTVGFWFLNGGSSIINLGSGASANVWQHIALVRTGTGTNQTKLYVDGINIGTGTDSQDWPAAVAYIGSEAASNYYLGYLDDFRITKGYARYTANFTPQTSQWQDQ